MKHPSDYGNAEKLERNTELYRQYLLGQKKVTLARLFGISVTRVDHIIRKERRRSKAA